MSTRKHSMPVKGRTTPDTLLERYPPHVVGLAQKVRGLIKAEVEGVEETAYLGWKTLNFRVDGQQFGYLALHPDRVHLGFDKGVLLDDPQGLLEGRAKMARSIRIGAPGSIRNTAIRKLIREAVRLNALAPGQTQNATASSLRKGGRPGGRPS